MKDIIILYNDGYMKVKNENKISKIDMMNAKWFLVNVTSTEEESRNYTLVKPSNLLLFDKAIISYQLCLKYQEFDMELGISEFDPVKFTTDSITDVISIINSADKLNIINNLMIEEYSDNAGQFGLTYLSVTLIKNNSVIYDKYFELKGVDSVLFNSYKVVNQFKELYNGNIAGDFIEYKKFLIFSEKNDMMRWNLSDTIPNNGMIGYPNVVSNSITIMDAYEYSRISKYIGSTVYYNVYYDKVKHSKLIGEYIRNGNYDKAFEKLDDSFDMFVNVSRMLHKNYKHIGFLLSIICNLNFIFLTAITMYGALYKDDSGNIMHEDSPENFDSVLSIIFRLNRKQMKTIAFNKDTILTPTQIFELI